MITSDRGIPFGGATRTAGVFSRDPYKWAYFAKHWYTPSLHQSSKIMGVSTLSVLKANALPKTILYPTDYVPLTNLFGRVIARMTSPSGLTVKHFNFTATVGSAANPA